MRISFPIAYQKCIKGGSSAVEGAVGPVVSPCGTAAGAARASGFGSPLVLRDFSSQRPGDGGSDPGHPAPTEAQRGGCGRGHSLLFTVVLSCPTRRTYLALPWAGGPGRIFRAASQPSLAPFHPVTPRPLTSAHKQGHTGLH